MNAQGLVLDRLTIRLEARTLVDLTLAIAPGEIVTFMGPSGCGKSTLLSLVAGTIAPVFAYEGRVLLEGIDLLALAPHRRHVGLLYQDALLFPHLSVAGNLLLALPRTARQSRRERLVHVEAGLAALGLSGFGGRDPASLSGGQAARVALLRTLLAAPKALLLDEPFSRLDSALRTEVRAHVFEQARMKNLPTVLVTHDEADARAAGGRVILLA